MYALPQIHELFRGPSWPLYGVSFLLHGDMKQDARRKAAEAATAERAPRDIKRNAQINYLLAKHQSISEI